LEAYVPAFDEKSDHQKITNLQTSTDADLIGPWVVSDLDAPSEPERKRLVNYRYVRLLDVRVRWRSKSS
jgi:hypothetical protein